MSDLRQTERDLLVAAEELRSTEIADLKDRRQELEERYAETPPEDIPADAEQEYQQAAEAIREAAGTADTYEHYGRRWGDDDGCVFVLEELNGDEYARVIDSVTAEAGRQARQDGSLPEGYGRVKSLEFGVVEKPDAAPADPGEWPAPIVNELFVSLNEITAPSGVDLGNESLKSATSSDTNTAPSPTVAPDGG